jgi:ribosome-binding protein aMBF1 (putative translation factor)
MLDAQRLTHASFTPPPGRRTKGVGGGGRRPIDVFVGQRLLTRRLELGLSHDDLAAAIHMPHGWIAAYERGEERIMPAHLFRFTELLDVKLRFFFLGA